MINNINNNDILSSERLDLLTGHIKDQIFVSL